MFEFKFGKKTLTNSLLFLSLLIVLLLAIPVFRPVVLGVFKFPLQVLTAVGREVQGIIFYHRNYVENDRLHKEVDLLRQRQNTLNEIFLENNRLKQLLSFKQRSPYRLIAARVIGHSMESWSSTVIVDKGSYNGVKKGMAVVDYLGLLGRVVDTTDSTSKVMLINDPSFAVSGIVQRSRQEGLVSGTLGSHLIMKYLPEDPDIQAKDVVVTSGLNASYPKGLLIGTVTEVGKEFSGLSRYAIINPAANISNIEEVMIIIQ